MNNWEQREQELNERERIYKAQQEKQQDWDARERQVEAKAKIRQEQRQQEDWERREREIDARERKLFQPQKFIITTDVRDE